MIIDAHVHVSGQASLALRQDAFGVDELLRLMDEQFLIAGSPQRIERAVVQPHPSDTIGRADIIDQHRFVLEAVDRHPDRFWGCMMFDPNLGVDAGLAALDQLTPRGVRAVKLHPTMHGWYPDESAEILSPLMRSCADLGLPVIIHTGDPPFSQPVQVCGLIEAHPSTTFILAHLATQQVSYSHQAIYVAEHNDNVVLEAGWGILPRIKDAWSRLGPERLLHASDCPIQEMGSQLRLLEVLIWDRPIGIGMPIEDLQLIIGGNALRLFGDGR